MSELEEAGREGPEPSAAPPVETVPESPARSDAEAFRLRPPAPRVVRLSRKVLAVIGIGAGLGIGGSLTYALQHRPPAASPERTTSGEGRTKSEVVTGAPDDYSKVPKLGAPLPGDLGRPILSAQQGGQLGAGQPDPHLAAAEQARQRMAQEQDAARNSRVFLGGGNPSIAESGIAASGPGLDADASNRPSGAGSSLPAVSAAGQSARRAFLEGKTNGANESAERLVAPTSPNILQAGTFIPAALITGIRSDLPGQVSAQVTQNVYDSPTGRILLISQGARLLGEYDSEISAGQNRVLLAWTRLILPDGRSIQLDRQPGVDPAGMAGLQDRTNHHWGNMLRAAAISTLLGVGSELFTGNDDRLTRALRYGTQDTVNQTGRQLVQREMNVPPTLTIRPGYPVRVLLTRDLILESVEGGR
ncbi:TrbI/VirB10 family protein [Sphingomonas lycopersici]|uniref:TrbI/VirB10 family protein n=1 Tax=Sphingomonas lycopersici TaxID=2951807 RepID=UPI003D7A968A